MTPVWRWNLTHRFNDLDFQSPPVSRRNIVEGAVVEHLVSSIRVGNMNIDNAAIAEYDMIIDDEDGDKFSTSILADLDEFKFKPNYTRLLKILLAPSGAGKPGQFWSFSK